MLVENDFEKKTKKLAEIIDTYGVKSKEYKNYIAKHTSNKYGLFYIFKRFGIKSDVFFNYIEPFIYKQMARFSYNEVDEDLIVACYSRMVVAHCGGYIDRYDKNGDRIYKKAYVENIDTISVDKWINFLITICRSVVKGRDYHYNKHTLEISHNDRLDDILSNSNLDELNYFNYSMKHFIFESSMQEHISEIFSYKPTNNLFYNLVQWDLYESDELAQSETRYDLEGETNIFNTYLLPVIVAYNFIMRGLNEKSI